MFRPSSSSQWALTAALGLAALAPPVNRAANGAAGGVDGRPKGSDHRRSHLVFGIAGWALMAIFGLLFFDSGTFATNLPIYANGVTVDQLSTAASGAGLTSGGQSAESLAILLGGSSKHMDVGYQKLLAIRKRQINEYMHRLEVIGLGDRRERMNPDMARFLDPVRN